MPLHGRGSRRSWDFLNFCRRWSRLDLIWRVWDTRKKLLGGAVIIERDCMGHVLLSVIVQEYLGCQDYIHTYVFKGSSKSSLVIRGLYGQWSAVRNLLRRAISPYKVPLNTLSTNSTPKVLYNKPIWQVGTDSTNFQCRWKYSGHLELSFRSSVFQIAHYVHQSVW